jgi:hypothetical protein
VFHERQKRSSPAKELATPQGSLCFVDLSNYNYLIIILAQINSGISGFRRLHSNINSSFFWLKPKQRNKPM